jgi:hypothetical protein
VNASLGGAIGGVDRRAVDAVEETVGQRVQPREDERHRGARPRHDARAAGPVADGFVRELGDAPVEPVDATEAHARRHELAGRLVPEGGPGGRSARASSRHRAASSNAPQRCASAWMARRAPSRSPPAPQSIALRARSMADAKSLPSRACDAARS